MCYSNKNIFVKDFISIKISVPWFITLIFMLMLVKWQGGKHTFQNSNFQLWIIFLSEENNFNADSFFTFLEIWEK